jgi:hypothetical protein
MKKLLTICLIMATVFTGNAQTEEETINWINAKKIDIMYENPSNNSASNFDKEMISSYKFPDIKSNDEYRRTIKWQDITDISFNEKTRDILIKGNVISSSGKNYISMSCTPQADKGLIDKMIKALTHMATLKGAKLVKDDLFGN